LIAVQIIDEYLMENHTSEDTAVTAINSSSIPGSEGPGIALTVPLELLRAFLMADGPVRIVSVIYRNVASLFSDLEGNNR